MHKLKESPYECFYVPDTIGPDEVRFARRAFPIWWLLASILLSIMSLLLCCYGATVIRDDFEKHGPMESGVQTLYAILCFGCIVAVFVVLFLLLSRLSDSPLGQVVVEAANLTRMDEDGNTILPQEEPVPTTPWWQHLLITLAILGGVALLFVLLAPSFLRRGAKEEEAEE